MPARMIKKKRMFFIHSRTTSALIQPMLVLFHFYTDKIILCLVGLNFSFIASKNGRI
jgi:hypothetical protein